MTKEQVQKIIKLNHGVERLEAAYQHPSNIDEATKNSTLIAFIIHFSEKADVTEIIRRCASDCNEVIYKELQAKRKELAEL
jgi:hypothetical protein